MMVWQRIGSALVAAPLVLWAVYAGGWPFMILLTCLVVIAWYELQSIRPESDILLTRLGYILLILLLYTGWRYQEGLLPVLTVAVFILLAALLWRYEAARWDAVAYTITCFCYLSLPLVHLIKLAGLPLGWHGVVLLLTCVWAYDSFAFFSGCFLGRHRPWPGISPNKSIEGVIGGLLGTNLVATLAFHLLLPQLGIGELMVYALPFGLGVGILAQTGDLFESALKRTFAVKDSGRFLPGHGGLLDRIDSVLFATPFVYYFLVMFVL